MRVAGVLVHASGDAPLLNIDPLVPTCLTAIERRAAFADRSSLDAQAVPFMNEDIVQAPVGKGIRSRARLRQFLSLIEGEK